MTDVVISYARSTRPRARQIAGALRGSGYSVWMDDELPVHREYSKIIEETVTTAKAVVVLWSAEAAESAWVCSEAERARQLRKLVQLSLDGARLPMPFDQIQTANVADWDGDTGAPVWRKVLASIADLVGGATTETTIDIGARASEPLLAVLAFDNLSGDPDMVYFSDGVSEEIQQTVARAGGLRVIGRGSSFQFRGANKAAAKVAAELRATHVLDGSVRRSGSRVRISAQLIACDTETMLWSERYDRELSDIFALQDEIAAAVSTALKTAFTPVGQPSSVDPDIYDLYLKACAMSHWTPDNNAEREQTAQARLAMLERVVSAAPGFARAWAMVAWDRALFLRIFDIKRIPGLNRSSVIAAANSALRLDPRAGVAYCALSLLEPWGRYVAREGKRRQALAVAPNDSQVLVTLAEFCGDVGRLREALEYAKRARDIDPLDQRALYEHAWALEETGRSAEARLLWDAFADRWPNAARWAGGAVLCAANDRDWDRFDQLVESALARGIRLDFVDHFRHVRSPDATYRQRLLRDAHERLATTGRIPLQFLTGLSQLGMHEQAFELIEQASFSHLFDPDGASPTEGLPGGGVDLIFSRGNQEMRPDVRFVRLCAKLGLCDYWVTTDRWPDCADQVPYDFKAEARRLLAAQS